MNALLRIDRRWIFLVLLVALIVTTVFRHNIHLPIKPSTAVEGVWRPIEELPARAPVLVSLDFDPASRAELEPMARAALRQMFRKGLRVIMMTHWPTGLQMSSKILDETVAEFDAIEVSLVK